MPLKQPPKVPDFSELAEAARIPDMSWITEAARIPDMSWITEAARIPDMSWITEAARIPDMSWITEAARIPDMSWITEAARIPDMSWITEAALWAEQNFTQTSPMDSHFESSIGDWPTNAQSVGLRNSDPAHPTANSPEAISTTLTPLVLLFSTLPLVAEPTSAVALAALEECLFALRLLGALAELDMAVPGLLLLLTAIGMAVRFHQFFGRR
ncbi:MAG: hypothetical protein OXH23_09645 [bacterium]|nr:hypothetical protein [bacterium]